MDFKKCPYCGANLEKGTLRSRGGNFFLPIDEYPPLTYSRNALEKRGAIVLPPEYCSLGESKWPTAFVCRKCKMIIIPFEE